MNHWVKKATIAALVMGTNMVSITGVTFAGTTTSTTSAPPSAVINGKTWYEVSTAAQLEYIDQNQNKYLNANIELMNNIDLTGYTGWVPFGGNSYAAYTGVFDGQGYGVSGLLLNDTTDVSTTSEVGFFGLSNGTIKNLGIAATVKNPGGHGVAGVLAGEANTITDCFSNGSVSGADYAGGLVGQLDGSITNSYSTASVSAAGGSGGGLIGFNNGDIQNSYATGMVSGANGGLVGADLSGNISGSFFDTDTTGQASGVGVPLGGNGSGTGETTANMKEERTFAASPANWDFTNTWGINPNLNNGYPYLLALKNAYGLPPLKVSPTVQPGTTSGTTAITASANTSGDILEYALSTQKIMSPLVLSPVLSDVQGSQIINLQTSNLLYNTQVGDYVGVYEVDPSTSQVLAFSQVGPLTSSDIAVANVGLPTIATVPGSLKETEGTTPQALSVFVESVRNPGTLSYQWYRNTIDSNSSGTAIPGAMNTFYIPSTTTVGTTYYYVVVTNMKSSVNGTLMASNTSSPIPVTVTAKSVDTLSSLTVSNGTLSPAFGSQVTSYKDQVDNSVGSIALTPTVTAPTESVTVSVYGNPVSASSGSYDVPLQEGDNPIEVKVKGQSGLSQTYTVDVIRASTPLVGQLPEVPFAAGLPVVGLAGAGVVWSRRRRKGKQV